MNSLEKPTFESVFDVRGAAYGIKHEGECEGKTCEKCFSVGNFKHRCVYCKWVFNRFECPNKNCTPPVLNNNLVFNSYPPK
jgi:hypothetical protein